MKHRIMYLRDSRKHPVGCVVTQLVGEGQDLSICYQVSVLNPSDDFNRKMGRQLAIGRLTEAPHSISVHPSKLQLTTHEISRAVMESIVVSGIFPSRAVKAAKRWLSANI